MPHEIIIGGLFKRVIQDKPNINLLHNTVDIYANEAVDVTSDLYIEQIREIEFPPNPHE